MLAAEGQIPARTGTGYVAEIACPWIKPEVVAFGISLHTHHYGYIGELFRIRNGTWTLLGSQMTKERSIVNYRIIGGFVDVKTGDILAARCLYINNADKPIKFGLSGEDEMCNAYFSFGYNFKDEQFFKRTGACITNLPKFSFCDHEQTAAICGQNNVLG